MKRVGFFTAVLTLIIGLWLCPACSNPEPAPSQTPKPLEIHTQIPPVPSGADIALSLDQAVARALECNKTLENVAQSLKQAEIYHRAVAKERLPKLATSYSYLGMDKDFTITTTNPEDFTVLEIPLLFKDNYSWNTGLNMPLYSGGAQQLNEAMAKLGIDVAKLRLIQARNELVLAVKTYFYTLARDEKYLEYLEQNLKSYEEHERLTIQYHNQGLVAKNSELEAKVETAAARQELENARQIAGMSRSALNLALDRDLNQPLSLILKPDTPELPDSLQECLNYAKRNNPELVAYSFLKTQAEHAVSLEKTYYVPKVGLSANYFKFGDKANLSGYPGYPNDILCAMLNLSWNFFDWGQKQDEAKIKASQLRQIINNEKTVRDNLSLKLKDAYTRIQTERQNIETSALAVVCAEENLHLAKIRYQEQVATAKEVIDALTALKRAEFNCCNALHACRLGAAALENAMGTDSAKIIELLR